jgi:hypothetical protein
LRQSLEPTQNQSGVENERFESAFDCIRDAIGGEQNRIARSSNDLAVKTADQPAIGAAAEKS